MSLNLLNPAFNIQDHFCIKIDKRDSFFKSIKVI